MRITFRIVSAGDRWSVSLPRVDITKCFDGTERTARFDEAEFRREIGQHPAIQISSNDAGGSAIAFGCVLLSSLGDWMDDNTKDFTALPNCRRTLAHFDRRMDAGKVSYCRVDISHYKYQLPNGRSHLRAVRVNITHTDNGVVQTERWDRDFAMLICDFVQQYSKRYVSFGDPPIQLGPDAQAIAAALHERTVADQVEKQRRDLNANRLTCDRHRNGYCSPCKPDCPCYNGGKCVEVTE